MKFEIRNMPLSYEPLEASDLLENVVDGFTSYVHFKWKPNYPVSTSNWGIPAKPRSLITNLELIFHVNLSFSKKPHSWCGKWLKIFSKVMALTGVWKVYQNPFPYFK